MRNRIGPVLESKLAAMNRKKRLMVALFGVIMALFLCYKLAISRTMELYGEFKTLQEEAVLADEIPQRLARLAQKEQQLDSAFDQMNLGNTSVENNLLKTISSESNNQSVRISDFEAKHSIVANNLAIDTYRFTLEGPFTDILKVLYVLEQKGGFGKTVHVDFFKERNFRTKKESLKGTVFLQQFN